MAVNEKHLDLIQAIITRHNSNSFMIKGWAITLCTLVLTVAGTWKEPIIALVALVPVFVFWQLDSFYLANEKCFVSLYSAAINDYVLKVKNKDLVEDKQVKTTNKNGESILDPETEIEITSSPFSMDFRPFQIIKRNNKSEVLKSETIRRFYLMLIAFSVALFIGLLIFNKPASNDSIKVSTKLETDSLYIKTEPLSVIINNIIKKDSLVKSDITTKKGK